MKTASPTIDVDGARIAGLLGLGVDVFRELMANGHIATLCERGTGDDAGHWRATFWHGARRARLIVDGAGRIVAVEGRPSIPGLPRRDAGT